jgi:hypothetical protein
MFITSFVVNLDADGTVRGVLADYAEIVAGRERPVGTRILEPADIEAHLPTTAALLAQIATMQADATAAGEALEAARAERDEKAAALSQAQGRVAELEAEIVRLRGEAERSIHKAWLRAALAEAGKLEAVDAAVQAAGPVKWELWSNATTISQDDPDVTAIASALGIDLAAVFTAARSIRTARGG